MQKLRPYVLPGIFVFHLLTVWVVFSTISPLSDQNNPTSLELVRILVCLLALISQFFLTALFAGLGAGAWTLRIPSWGALAALSWLSFVVFLVDSSGLPLSHPVYETDLWKISLAPPVCWIVLVTLLLCLRGIPFLKWRFALQPTLTAPQSHQDSLTRGILIVVASWAGVLMLLKDSWPWSADAYRRQGRNLFKAGADGVYIFNMFTSRESAPWNEPPFGVLKNLAP